MSLFISIEGPEGSGKTTIANLLCAYLKEKGYQIVYTREPGGSVIAEQIRNIVLDKQNTKMDSRTEALLFAASRRQHLVEKVIPALNEGKIVICDRFIDSSLAYQGKGRNLGIDEIYNVNLFATNGLLPDLTLYFDIDVEQGLNRVFKDKNREVNRLDVAAVNFHRVVREGYLEVLKRYPDRIKLIDASKTVDEVFKQAKEVIDQCLKKI
ncbi:MAG: dTMP kinase [Bacilli bacterium]|nr:dTMP kinase [Bacilli bacterium]